MNVLIAVATGDRQYVGSLNSCYGLTRRNGDEIAVKPQHRGDVGRDAAALSFLEHRQFDALLLLDGDQRHPKNLLERLRSHAGLDMVCAHYYRRSTDIIQSLCYPVGDGTYPQLPYLRPPRAGLHELLWTGFGCVLITRRVMEAVAAETPNGASPIGIGPLPDVFGDHENLGPDCRFFLRARRLGYRLWLDADVESLHATTIWLGHKSAGRLLDYTDWANGAHEAWEERLRLHGMNSQAFKMRLAMLEARKNGLKAQFDEARDSGADMADLQALSVALYEMDGKIKECRAWLQVAETYPPIEHPDQLPTMANTANQPVYEEDGPMRDSVQQARSADLLTLLPDVGPEAVAPNGHAN